MLRVRDRSNTLFRKSGLACSERFLERTSVCFSSRRQRALPDKREYRKY